jgi:hypothetical protein
MVYIYIIYVYIIYDVIYDTFNIYMIHIIYRCVYIYIHTYAGVRMDKIDSAE